MIIKKLKSSDLDFLRSYHNHELVIEFIDSEINLHGFVAVHSLKLGSAVGGTRIFPYANRLDALNDVLKLSKAMTYKCAITGVSHGGGKAVLIGNPNMIKNALFLERYSRVINILDGLFYTGEDVGMSESDIQFMLQFSDFFIGKKGKAGDPAPFAAMSTFITMQEGITRLLPNKSFTDITILVKGLGKVGNALVDKLIQSDVSKIFITDIKKINFNYDTLNQNLVKEISINDIDSCVCDVFSPCAIGSDITNNNVNKLKYKIVCGAANNQLQNDKLGMKLLQLGIYYIPDYLANSGGMINVVDELNTDGYKKERVINKIHQLKFILADIIDLSLSSGKSLDVIANRIVDDLLYASQ